MKNICLLITFVISMINLVTGQEVSNYVLIVNNDTIPLDLETNINHTLESGEVLKLKLLQSDILSFSTSMISFQYPDLRNGK